MIKSIAVVGSVNLDLTAYLDRWPEKGETIKTRETKIGIGGKGVNQCCAAAKLGGAVTMIGAIGDDEFGRGCVKTLEEIGVQTAIIVKNDHSTGMAFIDVGPESDNIIRIAAGANGALDTSDIASRSEPIEKAGYLLLQNEVPVEASVAAAKTAHAVGTISIMDPAPAPTPAWGRDVLAAFDILTPNGGEAGAILDRNVRTLEDAAKAAKDLAHLCRVGAIVTMGNLGVAWHLQGCAGEMECPKVDAIDTVGAGDCFNGSFAFALCDGVSYEKAIRFASHAASLSTTRQGAVSSLPSLDEVREFMEKSG
ncbi:ribokinase [Cohaesibacter sp. ES.047]|uniref:ribokinase n=1 Tax=Cohaesibacter sp. ES.047 TaxID=1798205 RepID=UPI000BC03477|nr:ribokinase [Cohaesibacter sp. ES.047]SNY90703.1 ribokinase [Cohaesibacter sp. ES.047]